MKAVLFLCLLALFACNNDIIATIKCIIGKPEVQNLGLKIISYIVNKNYGKILPEILNSLPDLIKAIKGCISEKIENDDEVVLKNEPLCNQWFNYLECSEPCGLIDEDCINACFDKYCK